MFDLNQIGLSFHEFAMEATNATMAREVADLLEIDPAEYSNCRHGRKGSLPRFIKYARIIANSIGKTSVVVIADTQVVFALSAFVPGKWVAPLQV